MYICPVSGSSGASSEVPAAGATSTSVEQEKYFSCLVSATPLLGNASPRGGGLGCGGDSLTSLDSLLLTELTTPDAQRRGGSGGGGGGSNRVARAVSSLRSSGGKARSKLTMPWQTRWLVELELRIGSANIDVNA